MGFLELVYDLYQEEKITSMELVGYCRKGEWIELAPEGAINVRSIWRVADRTKNRTRYTGTENSPSSKNTELSKRNIK